VTAAGQGAPEPPSVQRSMKILILCWFRVMLRASQGPAETCWSAYC